MKEIIEILDRLRELSGNEQLDYLKSHADNVILREVLWYAYNPDLKYNISEAKLDKASAKTLTTQDIRTSDYTIIDKDVWNSKDCNWIHNDKVVDEILDFVKENIHSMEDFDRKKKQLLKLRRATIYKTRNEDYQRCFELDDE